MQTNIKKYEMKIEKLQEKEEFEKFIQKTESEISDISETSFENVDKEEIQIDEILEGDNNTKVEEFSEIEKIQDTKPPEKKSNIKETKSKENNTETVITIYTNENSDEDQIPKPVKMKKTTITSPAGNECGMCLMRIATQRYLPCKHVLHCNECPIPSLGRSICPVCRTRILSIEPLDD